MIALAELHNLIKLLNKPEKRFFKLFSATENVKVDKAIALFDFIEKISENDDIYYKTEKDIKMDLSLHNLELLYNLILKSQRNFYSESITGFSLNDELSNLKILFEKAQYKQCWKMIKPLKEKSLANENFNYLLEIIELEKDLLKAEPHHADKQREFDKLLKQQNKYIEQEKNVASYYQLHAKLKYQLKSNNLDGKKTPVSFYEEFLLLPEIKDVDQTSSKKALLLLMKCRALCYTELKHQDLRCKQLLGIVAFVKDNAFLFSEMPRHYIDVLYNLASAYIELNEPAKVKGILAEMSTILDSKKVLGLDLIIKLQSYAYTIELLVLTYTAKYKEAYGLSIAITEFIEARDKVFNKENKAILLFNLTNFYIYNYNYSLAEKSMDKLLTESDKKGRWDLKCYTRIQQLIVCYELKQFSRLPLIIDVLKKMVADKIFTSETEIKSIAFFDEIISEDTYNVPEKKFKVWHNELKALLKDKKESWSNFNYFNFLAYSGYKAGMGEIKDIIHKNFVSNAAI